MSTDFRRYVRPFFLKSGGTEPTPYKSYYDIVSWLVTQIALSFAAIPFITLAMTDSILVWSRVYFYGIVGVVTSLAFFSKPGRAFLIKKIEQHNNNENDKKRAAPCVAEVEEPHTPRSPVLGLPSDPEKEFEGAVQEIKAEIEARRRRGSATTSASMIADGSAQVKKAAERIQSEREKSA